MQNETLQCKHQLKYHSKPVNQVCKKPPSWSQLVKSKNNNSAVNDWDKFQVNTETYHNFSASNLDDIQDMNNNADSSLCSPNQVSKRERVLRPLQVNVVRNIRQNPLKDTIKKL